MAKPVTTGASLAVRDLSFTVGGVRILDKVNLEVGAGEFLGVIGPNGAGKTTLYNVLSGLLPETGGEARLDGREITGLPVFARARAGLGRTFQTSSVFPRLSALENVRLAAEADAGGSLRIWGGTGSTLGFAQECLDRLRKRGIQKCHLFVFRDNRDALAFWKKSSWTVRTDLTMMSKSTIEAD